MVSPEEVIENEIQCTSYADGVQFTWTAVPLAESYNVTYDNQTYNVSSPSFFAAYDSSKETYPYYGKSLSITITAVNKAGESDKAYKTCETIPLKDYTGNTHTITYEVTKIESDSVTIKASGIKVSEQGSYTYYVYDSAYSTTTLIATGETNCDEITISGLEPAKEYRYGLFCKVTSKVSETKTASFMQKYGEVLSISTKPFSAPTNVIVEKIGRTQATISYTPLSDEELENIDKTNIRYIVTAKDAAGNVKTGYGSLGSTDPIVIKNLNAETEYTFYVSAENGSSSVENPLSEGVTATTKKAVSAPANVVLTESDGTSIITKNINAKFDDPSDDSVLYRMEYKILKSSSFTNYDGKTIEAAAYSADGITAKDVNGGNRYTVRIAAYDPEESDTVVYSDETTIQLTKIDLNAKTGTGVFEGLYDSEGDLASASISGLKATSSTYLFDMVQGTYFTYKDNGGTFAYDISDALSSSNELYMIFLSDGFSYSTVTISSKDYDLAYIKESKFIKPTLEQINIYGNFNQMSKQDSSTKKWTSPSDLSSTYKNRIYESYIYNNSLFVYIKYYSTSSAEKYVGFSFIY